MLPQTYFIFFHGIIFWQYSLALKCYKCYSTRVNSPCSKGTDLRASNCTAQQATCITHFIYNIDVNGQEYFKSVHRFCGYGDPNATKKIPMPVCDHSSKNQRSPDRSCMFHCHTNNCNGQLYKPIDGPRTCVKCSNEKKNSDCYKNPSSQWLEKISCPIHIPSCTTTIISDEHGTFNRIVRGCSDKESTTQTQINLCKRREFGTNRIQKECTSFCVKDSCNVQIPGPRGYIMSSGEHVTTPCKKMIALCGILVTLYHIVLSDVTNRKKI